MGVRYISYIYEILEKDLSFSFNSWITWFYTQGIGKTKGFSPRHDDILMFTKDKKDFVFNLDSIRVPQKFYRSVNNMEEQIQAMFGNSHICTIAIKTEKHTQHKNQKLCTNE